MKYLFRNRLFLSLFCYICALNFKFDAMKNFISMATFAGLLIGVSGLTYLRVGGVVGATLFSFGLLSVIMCGAQLFTGKSGFLPYRDFPKLMLMIFCNALGCALAACLASYCGSETMLNNLSSVLDARLAASWHKLFVTAMGTGMIMTLSVCGVRRKHYLPLLFGVPVFILCGLPHCVADAFYYSVAALYGQFDVAFIPAWMLAIGGNYVGCNLPRWFMGQRTFEEQFPLA